MIEARVQLIEGHRYAGSAGSHHSIVIDGDSKLASSPMEIVLMGLCSCTGYDVAAILRKKREPFTSLEISAEGDKAIESPHVYTAIRLVYHVGGKVNRKSVEDAVRLSEEKYCSVAAMLKKSANITYKIEYLDDAA